MTAVICLPFAGAQADPFQRLRAALPTPIAERLRPHTYPGHGRRVSEPFAETVGAMADDLVEREAGSDAVHLIGWSMGGAVAYEAATRFLDGGVDVRSVTFLACSPPPELAGGDLELSTDEALLDHCEQFGLIDRASFQNASLRRLFLPALRNDIASVDRYAGTSMPGLLPDNIDVTVVQGSGDRSVPPLADWSSVGGRLLAVHTLDGGHFFPQERPQQLAKLLLRRSLATIDEESA